VTTVSETVYVEPTNVGDFEWGTKDNDKWVISGYTGAGGTVKIPAGHEGKAVVSIAANAFYDKDAISSITIPRVVTVIGPHAFEKCGELTTVTLSDDVSEIGEAAFKDCTKLSNMKISMN
jgi:hypothetical protein